jgi:hypothetical protein
MNIKIADFGFSREFINKKNGHALNNKKIDYHSIDNIGKYYYIIFIGI